MGTSGSSIAITVCGRSAAGAVLAMLAAGGTGGASGANGAEGRRTMMFVGPWLPVVRDDDTPILADDWMGMTVSILCRFWAGMEEVREPDAMYGSRG